MFDGMDEKEKCSYFYGTKGIRCYVLKKKIAYIWWIKITRSHFFGEKSIKLLTDETQWQFIIVQANVCGTYDLS